MLLFSTSLILLLLLWFFETGSHSEAHAGVEQLAKPGLKLVICLSLPSVGIIDVYHHAQF
jgi:uncharacterized protein YggT (Ycf19 family)